MTLFDEFSAGSLNFRNRIALAPMTRARAGKSRVPNELMATYYRQRSAAGLLITEATTISEQGNGWNESPGIYTDEMTEAWSTSDIEQRLGTRIGELLAEGRSEVTVEGVDQCEHTFDRYGT